MPMRIDQGSLPAGEPGYARRDGTSDGSAVTLRDTTTDGTSVFEILWVHPLDTTSVATLAPTPGDDHTWTFQPTAGLTGPIRIRLTHTDPSGEITYETRIFGIPDADGRVPPAVGEKSSPEASVLNATDPAIINACERNWRTDEYPAGNPFGWSFDVTGPHATSHLGGSDPLPLASESEDGLMSSDDKQKLDGLGGPAQPTTHASTHVGGTDPIPVASLSTNGLMTVDDRIKLNGLGGPTVPLSHASTHVGGADPIPLASTSSSGLMSADDKTTLASLANAGPPEVAAHAATHVGGVDPIPSASETADGLMSAADKAFLNGLVEPKATLWLPLSSSQTVNFADIEDSPKGYIFAKQDATGGRVVRFEPPEGTVVLVEDGAELKASPEAGAYTLYEYEKLSSQHIFVARKKLTAYDPPLQVTLPSLFVESVARYSVHELLNNDYAGALFRVRRASDNAELDIGVNSGGTCDVQALTAFCGGSIGYVTKLYNQSGIGVRDFEQTVHASQPMIFDGSGPIMSGNNVMMDFDGINDYLSGAHLCGLTSLTPTAFVLWKPTAASNTPALPTPAKNRFAFCVGNGVGGWGLSQVGDYLYNNLCGRGFSKWQTLPGGNFGWTRIVAPKDNATYPVCNDVELSLVQGYISNEDVVMTPSPSYIGRFGTTTNQISTQLTHSYFWGGISTIVFNNTGVGLTAEYYEARDWCELRRNNG